MQNGLRVKLSQHTCGFKKLHRTPQKKARPRYDVEVAQSIDVILVIKSLFCLMSSINLLVNCQPQIVILGLCVGLRQAQVQVWEIVPQFYTHVDHRRVVFFGLF